MKMIDTRNFPPPTGGPAYPTNQYSTGISPNGHSQGMTLRDYFAAKAMQGFMANKANPMHYQPKQDAEWAYSIADSMLEARK
jgi:hypothetical protein